MRTRIVPACALVLSLAAVMSVAPRAFADDKAAVSAGADEVALKNGGLIRGTVVSVEPGTSVVILEAGAKQPRTIAWAEVADVERGKYAPPPAPNAGYPNAPVPPPPPPPTDQAAPPPPAGVGVVRLHVDSPEPVRVFQNRIVAQGAINGYGFVASRTDFVCAAPCDKVVDARDGGQFVVTGEMPAASFRLDDQQGDVSAHVTPGSRGLRAGGWVATGLGIGGMIAGGVLILTGAIQNSTNASSAQILGEKPPAETSSLVPIGGAVLGGSTALLVGGIVMIVVGRTGVDVGPRTAAKQGSAEPRTPRYWMGEF